MAADDIPADDVPADDVAIDVALAPLPLAVPTVLGKGRPAEGYPWHWSVCRRLSASPCAPCVFRFPERVRRSYLWSLDGGRHGRFDRRRALRPA